MKRGESGLSLVLGINKGLGMTSHDVVNTCRRIFGEGRVGHAGTLDPDASGVLIVGVGPATRMNQFFLGQDKIYEAEIIFGAETNTDDAAGEITRRASIPLYISSKAFACDYLSRFTGRLCQIPPQYSAVKINGVPAYKKARAGKTPDLASRVVDIYAADLLDLDVCAGGKEPIWTVRFHVSSGTYIRSLARDIGRDLHSAAHILSLSRTRLGNLSVNDCVDLDELAVLKEKAALNPLDILGLRSIKLASSNPIQNGNPLKYDGETIYSSEAHGTAIPSPEPLYDSEVLGLVVDDCLHALYRYDKDSQLLKSVCGFSIGVKLP
ncbi:MAG: tRNA pseudouridine(55) synthase TruB [Eggerthellaceae bacterium]